MPQDREEHGGKQLSAELGGKIRLVCRRAYALYDAGELRPALRLFYRAWLLLPRPQREWQESGWILTAIGDTYYRLGDYRSAREALESALHCAGIADTPFTHLRLGQSLRGLGMEKRAAAHLDIAGRRGGAELLAREDPDYRGRAALAPQSSGRSVEQ